VDNFVNKVWADWGQIESFAQARFLSPNCSFVIQDLPSVYEFRKLMIWWRFTGLSTEKGLR